jgi:hypothetical protein
VPAVLRSAVLRVAVVLSAELIGGTAPAETGAHDTSDKEV